MSTRFEELLRDIWRRCRERFEERLRPFELALGEWLNATLAQPDGWREGWAAFVEDWKAQGVVVSPEGYRAIEELLERMTHGRRAVAGLDLSDVSHAIQTSPLTESSSFDPRAGRMPYEVGDPPPQDSLDTSDPLRFDAQGNPREVVSISKAPGWYGQLWNYYDASAKAFLGPNGQILAETIRTYVPPAPPNTRFEFDTGHTYIEMSGVLPNDQMFSQGFAIAIPIARSLRASPASARIAAGDVTPRAKVAQNGASSVRRFWKRVTDFEGTKVYQRNDLIDPNIVDKLGRTNGQRMQQGLAPIGPDGKPLNLHHMLQTQDGPVAEITQTFHQQNSGTVHINPNTIPSGVSRPSFDAWRQRYWTNRARDFTESAK